MMQMGMYTLVIFNVAAILAAIVWGLVLVCKKKKIEKENNDPVKIWPPKNNNNRNNSLKLLTSILKSRSDEIISLDESELGDFENEILSLQDGENQCSTSYSKRKTRFDDEPYICA